MIQIKRSWITNIADNNCGDSDYSWWIANKIEDSMEELISVINDKANGLFVIIDEEEQSDVCNVIEWHDKNCKLCNSGE